MHTLEDPTLGEIAADISRAVVRVLHDHTGRGPTRARTELGANLVTVVLADTLTKGEQNLVAYGKAQMVLDVREQFQAAMRTDLVGAVEGITNRRVIAFMSQNHIDPDLAVEVFVLQPDTAD
jgi:uncharacterized protein YbcI